MGTHQLVGDERDKAKAAKAAVNAKTQVLQGPCNSVAVPVSPNLRSSPFKEPIKPNHMPFAEWVRQKKNKQKSSKARSTNASISKSKGVPDKDEPFIRFPLLVPTRAEADLLDRIKKSEKDLTKKEPRKIIRENTMVSPAKVNNSYALTTRRLNPIAEKTMRPFISTDEDVMKRPSLKRNAMEERYNSLTEVLASPEKVSSPLKKPRSEGYPLPNKRKDKVIIPSKYGFHPRSNSPTYKILDKARTVLDHAVEEQTLAVMETEDTSVPFEEFYENVINEENSREWRTVSEFNLDKAVYQKMYPVVPPAPPKQTHRMNLQIRLPPLGGPSLSDSEDESPFESFHQEIADIRQDSAHIYNHPHPNRTHFNNIPVIPSLVHSADNKFRPSATPEA